MNYRDVALLNDSLGNLSNTILQNRMMAEQKAERGQARQDRLSEQAKMDEYRQELLKDRMQTIQETKDAGAAKLAAALKKQAQDSLHDTFDTVAKHVADGTVKPETANQMLKAAVAKIPESLKDDPIVQMVSDPGFNLTAPTGKHIEPLAKQFGDTTVIYNPESGAFHVETPTKTKDTTPTVDYPFGPTNNTGVQPGRIKGPITDPTIRAIAGTNLPPIATPGQPAPAAPRVRKYNPVTGLIE